MRRITLSLGATSLKGALKDADEAMNRVADYAGIEVVEHTWGLTKQQPSRRAYKYESWRLNDTTIIPSGYHLVAEVTNMAPLTEPDTPTVHALNKKLYEFYTDPNIPGPKMSNLAAHQVGFRHVEVDGEQTLSGVLLDIDPILG
ncbi:MAG TPA: hypothetical protein VLF59_00175 [Candidatus Saccharimonadales bacterium]|nr:hypothetical protein [Candidatus Saccharimonadales bacterium]